MFENVKRMTAALARKVLEYSGKEAVQNAVKQLSARYDLAQHTGPNVKHYSNADRPGYSAIRANLPHNRRTMASRARYEFDNNGYCAGLVRTLATDVIGYTAPTLRVMFDEPGVDTKSSVKYLIEDAWQKWSTNHYINIPEKLFILDANKTIDGGGFWNFFTDPDADFELDFSLNCKVVADHQVTDPYVYLQNSMNQEPIYYDGVHYGTRTTINDDGVIVDAQSGNPLRFKVLSLQQEIYGFDIIRTDQAIVDKRNMVHWFHPTRPNQYRGVCEIKEAVPIFAQLRRYLTNVMMGAETATAFAGVMETTQTDAEGPTEIDQFTQFPIAPGMLVSLPDGWKATQFQPNANILQVDAAVSSALRECGRALDVPYGVVAGDSSKYNYSSARLDYTGYDERMKFRRQQLSTKILNPTFRHFLLELALRVPRIMAAYRSGKITHSWTYSVRPSIDPQKDASADDTRLKNGSTTLAEVYASRGMDWEEQMEQRSREFQKISVLGLDFEKSSAIMNNGGPQNDSEAQANKSESGSQESPASGEQAPEAA